MSTRKIKAQKANLVMAAQNQKNKRLSWILLHHRPTVSYCSYATTTSAKVHNLALSGYTSPADCESNSDAILLDNEKLFVARVCHSRALRTNSSSFPILALESPSGVVNVYRSQFPTAQEHPSAETMAD